MCWLLDTQRKKAKGKCKKILQGVRGFYKSSEHHCENRLGGVALDECEGTVMGGHDAA